MIDKRISFSKKLGSVSDKAKILWFMILPHLDVEGRIGFDDLDDLKDEVIPKFKRWTLKKIAECLNELAEIGLILLYPNGSKIAIQYEKFDEFQSGMRKDRESPSSIIPYGVASDNSGVFRITPALSLSLRNEGNNTNTFYDFKEEVWMNIMEKDIQRWEETYPACDVNQELKFMADWLLSNPSKKKSNYKRFISNWLRKSQDRGGTKSGQKITSKKEQHIADVRKKFIEKGKNDDQ